MTRTEHIKILWGMLRDHRVHFSICILLTLGNSVVLGGALSSVLPVMSSLFTSAGEAGASGAGFFGKILTLYNDLIPDSEYKQLTPIGIAP